MSDHDHLHLAEPTAVCTSLVMSHTQVTFALLKALLNGPTHSGKFVKDRALQVCRSIAKEIFDGAIRIFADVEPDVIRWRVGIASSTANTFDLRQDWSFCPLRQDALVPRNAVVHGD